MFAEALRSFAHRLALLTIGLSLPAGPGLSPELVPAPREIIDDTVDALLDGDDDNDAQVHETFAEGLGLALACMDPLTQTAVIESWAFDTRPQRRAAIARALGSVPGALAAPLALAHLSRDPSPLVRRAAGSAASPTSGGGSG